MPSCSPLRLLSLLSFALPAQVAVVDQEFIDFLQKPLEFMLHVAPNVERQPDEGPISTENATIVQVSFMYRYILRESCSQFDSLPLTSLRSYSAFATRRKWTMATSRPLETYFPRSLTTRRRN